MNISKLLFSNCLFILSVMFVSDCFGQEDTTLKSKDVLVASTDSLPLPKVKEKQARFTYFRVGMDLSKLVSSVFTNRYNALSFMADANYSKDINLILEGGLSRANTQTQAVSFQSNAFYLATGFDKNFFSPSFAGDKDNAFMGLRLGSALYHRQEANAQVLNSFFGNQSILVPAKTSLLYWVGLTAGCRLEIRKNIFVGWNVRGQTFINPSKIKELTPVYVAGYGNARKQPNLDYNFYVLYGFGKRK